jgi:hypothetical protein
MDQQPVVSIGFLQAIHPKCYIRITWHLCSNIVILTHDEQEETQQNTRVKYVKLPMQDLQFISKWPSCPFILLHATAPQLKALEECDVPKDHV